MIGKGEEPIKTLPHSDSTLRQSDEVLKARPQPTYRKGARSWLRHNMQPSPADEKETYPLEPLQKKGDSVLTHRPEGTSGGPRRSSPGPT